MKTSSTSELETSKKRRKNVGKACEPCRRRRCKCDGVRPACTTCFIYKDDCYWEAREDYRKPLSRKQIQLLGNRVKHLEQMLRDSNIDPGPTPDGIWEHPQDDDKNDKGDTAGSDGHEAGPSDNAREWSQDHLVDGEAGDLQVHGPTSAFRHLAKYGHHDPSPEPLQQTPHGFARFLPKDVYLSEQQHEIALDRFFRFYASWGQRTHPVLFRQDMETVLFHETRIKVSHYSPLLHNAILAIGLGFSEEPYLRAPDIRRRFAEKAQEMIQSEGAKPTVATVQGLAHLASYHSLAAEHNLGWLYIGMALRSGVALGLNMDDTRLLRDGKVTSVQARERNVTFWTTFIQEGLWAPYIGRSISLPEFNTSQPTVDEQLDQVPWEVEDQSSTLQTQPGMISTTFVETVKLMRIGERIMNTLYGIRADIATLLRTKIIHSISTSLEAWSKDLPSVLLLSEADPRNALPHILMLHLSHAWLVILLHRPFYRPIASLPSNGSDDAFASQESAAYWAVMKCDDAASRIIRLLHIWHNLHNLRLTPPTAIQCCFIAGTTHLLSMASSRTPQKYTEALDRVQDCVQLLDLMAVSWPAAQQTKTLLENLLTEYGITVVPSRANEAVVQEDRSNEGQVQMLSGMVYTPPIQQAFVPSSLDYTSSIGTGQDNATMNPSSWNQMYMGESSTTVRHQSVPNTLTQLGSGPSVSAGPAESTWDLSFAPFSGDVDLETQAFLDNILQPYMDLDVGQTFHFSP